MTAALLLSVPLGVLLGLGAWTLLALVPRFGAPRLVRRLAPHLADVSPAAREILEARGDEPGGALLGLAEPAIERARRLLSALLGGDEPVARRLRQAGTTEGVRHFRSRQLLSVVVGLAVGAAAAALAGRGGAGPLLLVLLVLLGGVTGLLLPEQLLARRARARQRRIGEELPAVLDLLALALSAGLGVGEALARVARGGGELAQELARVVADTHAGLPLPMALGRAADALAVPPLGRAVEQLVAALDRGAPLAEILRAQAADAREDARRRLIEAAGRKEVAMLVPLVALILPVTIAFALAPAVLVLQLGF